MTLLYMSGIGTIILIMILIWFGPPVILSIIGMSIKNGKPKAAKILWIIAGIYVLIGGGICGTLIS